MACTVTDAFMRNERQLPAHSMHVTITLLTIDCVVGSTHLCIAQVQDLSYLVQAMGNDAFSKRYQKLSLGLCEVDTLLPVAPCPGLTTALACCLTCHSHIS